MNSNLQFEKENLMRHYRHVPPLPRDRRAREAFQCPLCDYLVATDDDEELDWHETKHQRMLDFTRTFGPLMTWNERRAAEDDAARALNYGETLDDRVAGAELALQANYHKHLRRAVKGNLADQQCAWPEFVAAAHVEHMFPADVSAALRVKYGSLNRPEVAMKDWNYPP